MPRQATHPATVLETVTATVQRHPHRDAVASDDTRWTYQQLWAAAEQVHAQLQAAPCPPQTRVLLAVPPGPWWVAALLGVWKAGATAVLCHLDHPRQRRQLVAHTADLVLGTEETLDWPWPEQLGHVPLTTATPVPSPRPTDTDAGPVACVLHISGATGQPKPVMLTHEGVAERIAAFRALYAITDDDRIAQLAATSVDAVLWETLLALVTGACLHIPHGAHRIPGPEMASWLSEHEISVLTCCPTELAALPHRDLPQLRLIVLGGERLDPHRVAFWILHHQVANAYGPTEATIATHVCPTVTLQNPVPLGHPLPGVVDYVLDADAEPDEFRPVEMGTVGILYLGGTGLTLGYHGFPEDTAAAFPVATVADRTQRLYATGDLVYRRNDGQLVFVGRCDRQLNCGGVRIEPGEVETAAMRLDGVSAAVVILSAEQDTPRLELHAGVSNAPITEEWLRAQLGKVLPRSAVPDHIILWPRLPTTDAGKTDLATLARQTGP